MFRYRFVLSLIFLFLPVLASAIDIYGHRGARGLSPENTIPGYHTALAIGVGYVDMDIGITKDGVIVVTHDLTLNPNITKDSDGNFIADDNILIKDLTLDELQRYDVGELKPGTEYASWFPNQVPVPQTRIPTLKAVIDYVKKVAGDKVGFQIEIKNDPEFPDKTVFPKVFARKLAELLEEEGVIQRTRVQAFDWAALIEIQKINPAIKTEYLTYSQTGEDLKNPDPKIAGLWVNGMQLKDYGSIPAMIKAAGGESWGPQDIELTQVMLDEAHKLGLKVIAWDWNKVSGHDIDMPETIRMINMGVDGVISDRPDIVRGLLAARGKLQ